MLLVSLVGMMLPVRLSAMISVLLVRESAIHDGMVSGAEAPCPSGARALPSNCASSPVGDVVVVAFTAVAMRERSGKRQVRMGGR